MSTAPSRSTRLAGRVPKAFNAKAMASRITDPTSSKGCHSAGMSEVAANTGVTIDVPIKTPAVKGANCCNRVARWFISDSASND
jgi:hypothetical protein